MIEKGGFNRSKKDKKAIEAMAALLDGDEDHRIGGRVDVTALTDHMYEWCKAQMEYSEAVADVVLDRFCRRAALKGIRAGVAFALRDSFEVAKSLGKWQMTNGQECCLFQKMRRNLLCWWLNSAWKWICFSLAMPLWMP